MKLNEIAGSARFIAIIFAAITVLLGLLLTAQLYWVKRHEDYMGQLHRSARDLAVTLHREHHLQDPTSLHVLWWAKPAADVPGLTFHSLYLQVLDGDYESKWQDDGAGLWVFLKAYNYVTLGQACYLALHGEDSPRVRAVLEIAAQSYRPSSEADLLGLMDRLQDGDSTARAKFEEVLKWASWSFFPNRRYFEEDLMPSVDQWKTPEDHNKSIEATPNGAPHG